MRIEEYTAGRQMRIDGETYHSDLKIIDGVVKDNWWRGQGHRLDARDIADILDAAPAILVIGTGYAGAMRVPEKTRAAIVDRGIQVVAEPTGTAVETFNRLSETDDSVAGAFHLTC